MIPVNGTAGNGNRLLAALGKKDRASILETCEPMEVQFGETLSEPDTSIRDVYFPTTSYISLITPSFASESLEVGLVGNEGVLGVTLILGKMASPLKGLVQGSGHALRMSALDFRRAVDKSAGFSRVMNSYLYILLTQIAQTAACGRFHHLNARLARWILMTHDRAGTDSFRITHEFLSKMLGVRRSGVTEAAGALQHAGLLQYHHGKMHVLNRHGLEKACCPCYEIFNDLYRKHLGGTNGVAH